MLIEKPWYINSINYPREIVILLDGSGSMKGFRQILAILSIRTIIDSLRSELIYYQIKLKVLQFFLMAEGLQL